MSEKMRGPRRHGAAWERPDGELVAREDARAPEDDTFDDDTSGEGAGEDDALDADAAEGDAAEGAVAEGDVAD